MFSRAAEVGTLPLLGEMEMGRMVAPSQATATRPLVELLEATGTRPLEELLEATATRRAAEWWTARAEARLREAADLVRAGTRGPAPLREQAVSRRRAGRRVAAVHRLSQAGRLWRFLGPRVTGG